MNTLAELQQEIKVDESQLETLRKAMDEQLTNERSNAIVSIKDLVKTYQIKPAELWDADKTARKQKPTPESSGRSVVMPKYRDQASGSTWAGRGKLPRWLAEKFQRAQERGFPDLKMRSPCRQGFNLRRLAFVTPLQHTYNSTPCSMAGYGSTT